MSTKTKMVTTRVCDWCGTEIGGVEGFHVDEMLTDGSRIEIVTPAGEREDLAIDQVDFCDSRCAGPWFGRLFHGWEKKEDGDG